jgi:hypothetical protein
MRVTWDGFNNVGVCATAIASVLGHSESLSLPKVMLIMPLVMHDMTIRFLANGKVRERQIAAFTSMRPEFVANFDKRYFNSFIVSINAIQLLLSAGYVEFDGQVNLVQPLEVDKEFGKRGLLIAKAAKNISALLASSDDELYLNLRVKL